MNKLLIIFMLLPLFCLGQKQGNIWYFGNGAGLDFNDGCEPTVLTDGSIGGFEGCATIADNITGELLFYTNSDSVWNRNHTVMPNGHLISNGATITQVLIIQKPSYSNIYYIITSEVQGSTGQGLQCHEVDMNLNGGLGGLTYKDSLIYSSPVTEKITAVKHANGTDIWLIAHEYNSNKFLSYLVTASGINTTPIISPIGKIHYSASTYDAIGEMKASPDGSKIAVVTANSPNIELFDFDNSTGQISNLITLPENGGYDQLGNPSGLYGASFSANNTMLYVSKHNLPSLGSPGQVMQFNITSNDSATINNSRVNVFTSTSKSLYSLQLAPNRKIYVGQNVNNYIGVINSPDSTGLNCDYADNGLYLNGKLSGWGLNNLMEYGNYCNTTTSIDAERKATTDIKIAPNPFASEATFRTDKPLTNATLTLYNAFGQQVRQINNISGETLTLNRDNLADGLYYLQLTQDNQTIATKKLVITSLP